MSFIPLFFHLAAKRGCTRRDRERLADCFVLVFDNWRVMHARSAFEGKRRMCGGYSELPFTPSWIR